MIATTKIYKFQVERIMKNANVLGLTKPLGKHIFMIAFPTFNKFVL